MADGLLNKASIILTPTGYKAGTLYNVAPVVEPYEDFDFARASVASRVNSSGLVEMVGRTLSSELVQNGDFRELGSELVTDGDFPTPNINWSLTNATIESDGARINNTVITGFSGISQLLSGTLSNKQFIITYDVIATNGQNLVLDNGTSLTLNTSTIGVGKELYFEWTRGDNYLVIKRAFPNTDVTIDNVSVKQVDPNDYWTLGTGVTIEQDKLKIDGGALQGAEQNNVITSGLSCKVTFTVSDYVSGTVNLRHPLNKEVTANGTYTFYGDANSAKVLIRGNAVSNEFNITNISVKEVIDTNNIPRISYDSNGDNGHILLEPTSTNLITYSEDFSQWTPTNATTTQNVVASPDGTVNANKIIATSTTLQHRINFTSSNSSGSTTFSFFAKSAEYNSCWARIGLDNAYFDLENGLSQAASGTTSSIEDFGNGWYRCIMTKASSNANEVCRINITTSYLDTNDFLGDDTSGIYVYGAQHEQLSYATSYIPTLTGSTVTRATETATGAGSADLINSTEGVLYAEIAALANDGTFRMIGISDGTESNVVNFYYRTDANKITIRLKSGGSQVIFENFDITATNFSKIAFRYKSGESNLFIDGVKQKASDYTTTNMPSGLNELAFDSGGGGQFFYGKCKALAVFNEALSDSELTQLTT